MRALAVPLVVVLAGCLGGGPSWTVGPGDAPSEGDYAVAWVHGEEIEDLGPFDARVMCSVALDHVLDAANRTLQVTAPPASPRSVVVWDVFARPSDCPLAFNATFDAPSAQNVGRLGSLHVSFLPNGTLRAHDRLVAPGEQAQVTWDEGKFHGKLWIENKGKWPRGGLLPLRDQ